jgi:DNA-binding beta-propeller fold protein YncE
MLLCALFVAGGNKETTLLVPPFEHDFGYHRASKFWLDMFLGWNFRFDDPEGLACEKLAAEDDPGTSMDDHVLTLLGVNSGSGQILYNTGMTKVGVYGRPGSGDTALNHPHGIAVNRAGDIYVADTDNDRVVRLRYVKTYAPERLDSAAGPAPDSGKAARRRMKTGVEFAGAIPGFSRPYGVALDSRNLVYVTDTDSSRVVVLGSSGKPLARWDGFTRPTGIAVIDSNAVRNFYAEQFAVVIDNNGLRLTRLSLNGERQVAVTARDIGLVSAEFAYCAVDYYANVYVTDRLNDQIHKFDRELRYLASFGRTGTGDGEFRSPRGIAIGRQFGQVFISEAEGGQYYWVGLDGYFIGCFPEVMSRDQPGTTIALYTTEIADLTISVYDRKKRLVRGLYSGQNREKAGEMLLVWDGRDNAGKPVPPGEYTVQAILKPTYGGMRRYFRKELTTRVKRV